MINREPTNPNPASRKLPISTNGFPCAAPFPHGAFSPPEPANKRTFAGNYKTPRNSHKINGGGRNKHQNARINPKPIKSTREADFMSSQKNARLARLLTPKKTSCDRSITSPRSCSFTLAGFFHHPSHD
jgi:hypothetical protein